LPDEGVAVSEEMARDANLRDIPVIMVSSVAHSEYTGYFPTDRPLHVHLFLDKPVSLQKLLDVANDFVQQQETSV
jgi:response regulator RpfG family c-di-GMP phosphodiesterase